ncbi:MAG: hypothetical protein V1787_02360 [Candidatus Micrarchaeota archaeon]
MAKFRLGLFPEEYRTWGFGSAPSRTTDGSEHHAKPIRNSSWIVQAMSLVEDFTPIKPVMGANVNSFEDGMMRATLFGLNQRQVFLLIIIGLVYALMFQV